MSQVSRGVLICSRSADVSLVEAANQKIARLEERVAAYKKKEVEWASQERHFLQTIEKKHGEIARLGHKLESERNWDSVQVGRFGDTLASNQSLSEASCTVVAAKLGSPSLIRVVRWQVRGQLQIMEQKVKALTEQLDACNNERVSLRDVGFGGLSGESPGC